MTKLKSRAQIRKGWILPITAIACFGLTELAARNPNLTESWYSKGIYPFVAQVASSISSVIPLSVDDLFYIALLLCIPVMIALLVLRKISFRQAGKLTLNILATGYIAFYLLWGFNYYRQDLNARLNITAQQPDKQTFLELTNKLIDQTNRNHCSLENLSAEKADSLVEFSYKQLAPVLKFEYPMGKREDKSITFSHFFAQSGISGYFGPFFNEVHVNKKVLPIEYPVILAHEKAHQLGVTSEAEANFYAWFVCSQSDSKELNYAANLYILRHFLRQAYPLKEYPELAEKISPQVKDDFNRIRQHWMELRNEKLDQAASTVNNAYLKTNKVEAGIQDYSGVVKLVLDFSLDSAFQQSHSFMLPE
ncbi:DUF3810 domain-containing protein [Maribellus luteus]|uniref:DUF3810 domain-containing protein n=1 Tax=Maribellus luteus TaxID=2305463 RepID=A0A399T7Q3_9BACT|nr:DUF3810 domain-containing protein [Maribellus luteus]RIJ49963.1 DUF3810 domain-containing protein [Maribellus luteus]